MKIKPTLSIIIVSYNTAKITQNCLQSVFKDKGLSFNLKNLQPNHTIPTEIIVIDNGSQDGTTEMIKEIEEKIPEVILNGPRDNRICNNLDFSFKHIEGESLLMHSDAKSICVSTGSACSSTSLKPSHVLMAIGLEPEVAHGSIRFSLSKYNTEEEIDYVIENLIEIVKNLRAISPL